jgi:hypothetical protein
MRRMIRDRDRAGLPPGVHPPGLRTAGGQTIEAGHRAGSRETVGRSRDDLERSHYPKNR